jgi:hypothetical protein
MLRAVSVLLVGAVSGFLVQALIQIATYWVQDAGSKPSSDAHWGYLYMVSLLGGAPVGAAVGLLTDRTVLREVDGSAVFTSFPFLLVCALVGALPGIFIPVLPPFTASLSLLAGAALVAKRWQRRALRAAGSAGAHELALPGSRRSP